MPWISLDEAKAQLNKSAGARVDDGELVGFIAAACSTVEDLKGHVDVVGCTQSDVLATRLYERHHHGYLRAVDQIELVETPVLSVTSVSVTRIGGALPVPQADPLVGTLGWTSSDEVVRVPYPGRFTITYRAGRSPVPSNYRLAALELVTHLWRGSQLNQSSGRPAMNGDQMQVIPHIASALPYRVRELLGIYGEIVNDHVVIG